MKKGFSYIETIIALAVFSIALIPLLPLLAQASRNELYMRKAYSMQLHAQGILAVARNAVVNNENITQNIEAYISTLADKPHSYGIWYDGFELLSGEDDWDFAVSFNLNGFAGKVLAVICRGEDGIVYGRAVGAVPAAVENENNIGLINE